MSSQKASPFFAILTLLFFTGLALVVTRTIENHLAHQHHEHQKPWQEHQAEGASVQDKDLLKSEVSGEKHQHALVPANAQRPAGAKVRTLEQFYSRRAYPGAPPVIPHVVENDGVISHNCLSCHDKGGYVPKFNAFAPLSPHPEKENCRQCHVPQAGQPDFAQSQWLKPKGPQRGISALGGSPLKIPHTLQLRENCLSCHGGPAAVEEIRVSHPERENCRQCHVPTTTQQTFESPYGLGNSPATPASSQP